MYASLQCVKRYGHCLSSNLVCSVSDATSKFCMTILYEDSVNPDYVEGRHLPSEMSIAAEVCPTFTYHDHHCTKLPTCFTD